LRNSFAETFSRYIGVMKCSSMAMVFMVLPRGSRATIAGEFRDAGRPRR
jgi:hypothetical protein